MFRAVLPDVPRRVPRHARAGAPPARVAAGHDGAAGGAGGRARSLAGFVGMPPLLTGGMPGTSSTTSSQPVVAQIAGDAAEEHARLAALRVGPDRRRGRGRRRRHLARVPASTAATAGSATDEAWAARFPAVHRVLANKYYVDELYDATVVRGTWAPARGLFRFDAGVIDGVLVNGARNVTVDRLAALRLLRQVRRGRPGQPGGRGPRPRLARRSAACRPATSATTRWCWRRACSSWSASTCCCGAADAVSFEGESCSIGSRRSDPEHRLLPAAARRAA